MRQLKKEILQFDLFLEYEDIVHGMNTRLGGVSQGIYSSLNMGWGLGDEQENVRQNYRIFANALGMNEDSYTLSDQVHQTKIVEISSAHRGNGYLFPKMDELKGIDGLITKEKGVALTVFSADCVPLIFYDPIKQVVAAAHSGWRGTVADIAGKMIDKMKELYQCEPSNILVGIGPCISKKNFEVGEDVKKEFENKGKYDILKTIFEKKENGKYLLDLRKYIVYALQVKGVLQKNMEVSTECTYQQEDLFFSHRRNGLQRGSHIMVISMI